MAGGRPSRCRTIGSIGVDAAGAAAAGAAGAAAAGAAAAGAVSGTAFFNRFMIFGSVGSAPPNHFNCAGDNEALIASGDSASLKNSIDLM